MLLPNENKQKNTPYNIASQQHQYKVQITKGECRLYSPQALVTWADVTSLKPGQAWFPRMACLGDDGTGEDVQGNEPCPMDLACLFPSARAHNLQTGGPPAVKLCPLHPKDMEPLS